MDLWTLVAQGGAGATAAVVLFLFGFKMGWWSTSQEVQSWKHQLTRMEELIDELVPAVRTLTETVNRLREGIERRQT